MRTAIIVASLAGLTAALFFTRKAAASSAPEAAQPGAFDNVVSDVLSVVGPRGIRNNNPGNIRRTSEQWQGMAPEQTDPEFVQFITPEDGFRAWAIILRNYRIRYGAQTLQQIITRWAPPSENDTQAYINSVSSRSGIAPDAVVHESEYPQLLEAMTKHENGVQPYTLLQISEGVARA